MPNWRECYVSVCPLQQQSNGSKIPLLFNLSGTTTQAKSNGSILGPVEPLSLEPPLDPLAKPVVWQDRGVTCNQVWTVSAGSKLGICFTKFELAKGTG